ncbi:MAG: acyltransferase [Alphaproteobacteria bacterium]
MLRNLLQGRYLGVDFFWVLSGFVLAYAYEQRLKQGITTLEFMRIRLIRLYPLYLLGLSIGVSVYVLNVLRGWHPAPVDQIGVAAFFGLLFLPVPPIGDWTGTSLYPFNGPSWTLFFELVANLVYAALFRFLNRWMLAAVLVVAGGYLAFSLPQQADLGPGWLWPHFDVGLARSMYCFFAGVAAFRISRVVRVPALPAWVAFLCFLAIIAAPIPDAWRRPFDAFAAIVLMPALVLFASGSQISGRLARVCAVLGLLSYGVYVLHMPLSVVVNVGLSALKLHPPGVVLVLGIALGAGIVAALADRFYDGPVRRWLTARTGASRSSAGAGRG